MSQNPEIFVTPQIYFPKLFTAVSKTVPHIEMTAKEAVAAGYSFRKKRHSIKITNYHGRPHKNHIIPYSIDGMPVDELGREAFRNCTCCIMYIHGNIRRLGEAVFKGSTMYKVIFEDGLSVFESCDINAYDRKCCGKPTALMFPEMPETVIRKLAEMGADINHVGDYQRTPLLLHAA